MRRTAGRQALDDAAGDQRDVLGAFAQGRGLQAKNIQPVVQVLSETPAPDRVAQILMGGGDDPDVDGDGLGAAETKYLALLQHAQQTGL